MRAIILTEYGPPEVLKMKEITTPSPKDNKILIKIFATSINFGDMIVRKYKEITPKKFHMPYIFWLMAKIYFGINRPKISILGSEFSGEITVVGKKVIRFKKGDKVFGYTGQKMGTYTEYLCFPEKGIIDLMPKNMSFIEASAVPYGAITALSFVRKLNIRKGQKILVNGASGGIGPYIIQLAKHLGAEVTGVCSSKSLDFVKSLGTDKVIDYKKEDFTKNNDTYDIIIDILGKITFTNCKSSLKTNGILLYISFKMKQILQMFWTQLFSNKKVKCALSTEKVEDLVYIKKLIEEGNIKSYIDTTFPLEKADEAHRYIESGNKAGSVVLVVNPTI